MAPAMLRGAGPLQLVADEEYLPIENSCLDLIVSSCGLHWANDLPGVLIQSRQALKPDGLLLVNFFGGNTLTELRRSLLQAEMEVEGALDPRVSPFADIRDAGALLQRANLALPVADTETITVSYDSPMKLFRDLRGMGETNAVIGRRKASLEDTRSCEPARFMNPTTRMSLDAYPQPSNSLPLPDGLQRKISRNQRLEGAVKCR